MGLKPIPNGHTASVTVGDATYQLREAVSMADLVKTKRLIAKTLSYGARAAGMYERFMEGTAVNYDEIETLLETSNQASFDLLQLWLVGWSHSDDLTRANIERLDMADQKAISRYIKACIDKGEENPANPTPPDEPSIGSSEPSSLMDESTGTA